MHFWSDYKSSNCFTRRSCKGYSILKLKIMPCH